MKTKISVVVPVYNSRKYLNECIDSILNQTFKDFELILVDDGSSDGSERICDEYAAKDSRVRVIHKENGGVSSARNTGIDAACSEWITFVDCDDSIDNTFFESAVYCTNENPCDVYISGMVMECWNNGVIEKTYVYTNNTSRMYNTTELLNDVSIEYPIICISGPCCKLFKRDLIEEHNIRFNETMSCGEDTDFNLEVIDVANSYYFDNRTFYHYRRAESNSLFSAYRPDLYDIYSYISEKRSALLKKNGCSEKAYTKFLSDHFGYIDAVIQDCFHVDNKSTKKQRKQHIRYVCKDKFLKEVPYSVARGKKRKFYLFCVKHKLVNIIYLYFNKIVYKNGKR